MKAKGLDYLASLRLMFRYLDESRLLFAGALIFAMVAAFCEILPVWLLSNIITAAMDGSLTARHSMEMAALMFGGIAGCFVATGFSAVLGHLVAFQTILRMRLAIVEHMARVPLGYLRRYRNGDAKRLVLDDPDGLEGLFAHALPDAIGALCLLLMISVWLIVIDRVLAISAIVPALAGLAALVVAMRRSTALVMRFQAASMTMNVSIVQFLSGIAVLKIFRGGFGSSAARRSVRDYTNAETAMSADYIPFGAVFTTLIAANVAFILPVGLLRVHQGVVAPATLLFSVILGVAYGPPLLKLFAQFHRFASISLNATLAADLLAVSPQYDSGRDHVLTGSDLTFADVSYTYQETPALQNVSFIARQGQLTALVGPSGAGKTTIANLALRLFDTVHGTISIGGVDIKELSVRQLRNTVASLPQAPFLFNDTLLENIRIGRPDASDAQVLAAAKAAQLQDFVDGLPHGLKTPLGRGGVTPSGGEKQRIAIARLLLKDAPIVVLDEATAFLDADNEDALVKAIEMLAVDRTVVVIAHRLNTVRKAENIVVLNEGQVQASGTHDELLSGNVLYASLWASGLVPQTNSKPHEHPKRVVP